MDPYARYKQALEAIAAQTAEPLARAIAVEALRSRIAQRAIKPPKPPKPRPPSLFTKRYPLVCQMMNDGKKTTEIARSLGVSHSRANQIKKQAKRRMRALAREAPRPWDYPSKPLP